MQLVHAVEFGCGAMKPGRHGEHDDDEGGDANPAFVMSERLCSFVTGDVCYLEDMPGMMLLGLQRRNLHTTCACARHVKCVRV